MRIELKPAIFAALSTLLLIAWFVGMIVLPYPWSIYVVLLPFFLAITFCFYHIFKEYL